MDVEEIDGRIDVASVVTGAVPARQVEALVRVEDETSHEDARVRFAIVPWLFFVRIAVLMKKEERIFVIDSWDADLGQELYRWDEVRAGLQKVEANGRAAARPRKSLNALPPPYYATRSRRGTASASESHVRSRRCVVLDPLRKPSTSFISGRSARSRRTLAVQFDHVR
jgi:hypothetical protein